MEQVLFSFSVRIMKPNDCLSIIKANSIFKILFIPISVNTMGVYFYHRFIEFSYAICSNTWGRHIFFCFYHSLGIVESLSKTRKNELDMISMLFLHSLSKYVYSFRRKGHGIPWARCNSFRQWSEIIPSPLGSCGSNSSFKLLGINVNWYCDM